MTQRQIDLLPDAIRARSRAHVRTGRYVAAALIAFTFATTLVVWSRVSAETARSELRDAETRAAEVLALETRAKSLRGILESKRDAIERYHQVELPLRVSAVLATVINRLPDSVSLDQVSVEAGHRRSTRRPRSTNTGEVARRRLLTVELSGFARTDAEIAELVDRLTAREPFQDINLDFSRSRTIRGQAAREFRLSFRIDLESRYVVTLIEMPEEEYASTSVVAVEAGDEANP